MARTRNFDPGRNSLHYAPTLWRKHAKPLVYAFWLVASLGVTPAAGRPAGQAGSSPPGRTSADAAPCVACQAISIAAGQIAVLPRALNGALVLLRVAPATPPAAWTSALTEIRALGGRPGLHLTAIPGADDPLLAAGVDTLVLEARGDDLDRVAFALKRALAIARGKQPTAALLVTATPDAAAALRERGVAPYVSEFVAPASPVNAVDELMRAAPQDIRVRELPIKKQDLSSRANARA